jgi:hypothetical protein
MIFAGPYGLVELIRHVSALARMPRAIRKSKRGCRSSIYRFWTDFRERSRWSAFHSSTPGLLDPVLNNDSLAVDTNQVLAAWRLVDPRRSAMRTQHRCHNLLARR